MRVRPSIGLCATLFLLGAPLATPALELGPLDHPEALDQAGHTLDASLSGVACELRYTVVHPSREAEHQIRAKHLRFYVRVDENGELKVKGEEKLVQRLGSLWRMDGTPNQVVMRLDEGGALALEINGSPLPVVRVLSRETLAEAGGRIAAVQGLTEIPLDEEKPRGWRLTTRSGASFSDFVVVGATAQPASAPSRQSSHARREPQREPADSGYTPYSEPASARHERESYSDDSEPTPTPQPQANSPVPSLPSSCSTADLFHYVLTDDGDYYLFSFNSRREFENAWRACESHTRGRAGACRIECGDLPD